MKNWTLISDLEAECFWNIIYNEFQFQPNKVCKELILLPKPNILYDISNFYNDGFKEELYNNLHESAIIWFKDISEGSRIYAFNWQHECYSFLPELPFEKDEFDEWLISVFPNGDYIFFMSSDFKNGIFADGINLSISFFGEKIIKSLEFNKPNIFF